MIFYVGLLFLTSFLLVLPQLITRNMILGSDAMFHFNRIYETSQQIKHNNFDYFISLYGFQQSGRIVNPLYAPLLTYLFGLLLLICGTWFRFQVVLNFLLFFISGLSMFTLLRKVAISKKMSFSLSVVYMTSYSLFYWITRQGFTSWGAVFLPLCLIPVINIIKHNQFKPIQVAVAMAVMFQIHFLSSGMLLLFYVIAFIPYFLENSSKGKIIKRLVMSIALFMILTINMWYSLWRVYGDNQILAPFVNKQIYKTTITGSSKDWLVTPWVFPIIILFVVYAIIKHYKHMSRLNKYFSVLSVFFLIMASNLFPWKYLYEHDVEWINIIQFPFRFFVPASVSLLVAFGLSMSEKVYAFSISKAKLVFAVSLCLCQGLFLHTKTLMTWNDKENYMVGKKKHLFTNGTSDDVKASFYSKDLSQAIQLVEKSTPDYLPIYDESTKNKYELYEAVFFTPSQKEKFKKTVEKGSLLVEWNSTEEEDVIVPIVKYKNTQITYNGKELSSCSLTTIGNPILESKKGQNELRISYNWQG